MPDSFASAIAACLAIGGGPPARALEDLVREVLDRPERPGRAQLADMQERIERRLPGGRDRLALVYGGATKIKGYVFEAPSLPEIRGASALLDRINTIDLPRLWDGAGLRRDSIVYASGGNLLAFAPAHHAAELAAEIERTYARETLLANSVAVSATFQLLEIGYGLRPLVEPLLRRRGKPRGLCCHPYDLCAGCSSRTTAASRARSPTRASSAARPSASW